MPDTTGTSGIGSLLSQTELFDQKKATSQLDKTFLMGNDGTGLDFFNAISRGFAKAGIGSAFNTLGIGSATPETSMSFLKKQAPKGDNLQDEIRNMNPTMIQHLVDKNFFGDEGKQILNKIYTTGAEYKLGDAVEDIKKLNPNTDLLGGYGSFKSLIIGKNLLEQQEQQRGQKDVSELSTGQKIRNFFSGALFMDGKYSTDMSPVTKQAVQESGIEIGNSTLVVDNNTDELYAQYPDKETALKDKDYIREYFDLGLVQTKQYRGNVYQIDPASNYIRSNSFEKDGKFYVKLDSLDLEKQKYYADIVSREDRSNIAGQTLGVADIVLIPTSGVYTAAVKGLGKGAVLTFNTTGKLVDDSLKALQDAVSAGKITSKEAGKIQRVGKAKVMLAESRKPSITKKIDNMPKNIDKAIVNETATTGVVDKSAIDDAVATLTSGSSKNKGKTIGTKNITQEQKDNVIKLKTDNPNITTQEIIKLTNVGKSSIGNILMDAGLTVNPKFTADEIKNIIELRKQGLSIKEISEQTGKSTQGLSTVMKDNKLRDVDIKITNMNEVAKNFDPNNQQTWKNSLLVVKDSTGTKETHRFVFPENEQVKKTIVDFINNNVRDATRGSGSFTVKELGDILGMPSNGSLSIAIKNLDDDTGLIKKYVKSTNTGDKDGLRNQLEKIWRAQNPEEAKELALLRKEVKKLNDELGLTGYDRFEVDHIRSIIDDYHNTGAVDFSTKNVQIVPKFVNQGGFQRNGKNLIDLPEYTSKLKIFENTKFGIRKLYKDLQKPNISAKEKKEIQKAIKEQWNTWSEIVDDHEVLFDFTDYKGKLPDEYLIKNKTDNFDAFEQLYNLADDLIGQESSKFRQEYLDTLLADGGPVVKATTPEKDRIKGQEGISVGNPEQSNLYGFNMDKILEDVENKKKVSSLYDNKESDIPAGKFDPYAFAKIIDREDEFLQKKRELGYKPIGQESKDRAETKFNLLPKEKQLAVLKEDIQGLLNPGKPSKLKLNEISRLVTQNPFLRQIVGTGFSSMSAPAITLKAFADDVVGMLQGEGEGFEETSKIIPTLTAISRMAQPEFADEQKYISIIDEVNKMQDAGINNLAFGFLDALSMGLDFMANTNTQEKVLDLYDQADIAEPETFLGKLGALGIELGAPVGGWLKVMNRARTFLRAKGVNTFVDKSTDVSGFAYLAQKTSNIAKRSAVGATLFGVSDAASMSRYSTINKLFDDPLLLSDKESIEGLSGRELALANFRNRARFGADGALIGGVFPLVGPPAWAVTKIAAGEIGSAIGAVGKYVINPPMTTIADTLAGKSTVLTKAAEDTVAIVTGIRPNNLTEVARLGGYATSESIKQVNNFVGKQIVTRALLGGQDLTQMVTKNLYGRGINMEPEGVSQLTFLTRQIPDRKEWSMFSVNTYDPLKQNLARIDNVMGMFRDIGKLTSDAFFLSNEAKLFIKSNMRATEDYLKLIDDEAYNLAQNFQKRYNKYGESKHIQNHFLDQVLGFLRGKVKLKDIAPELKEPAQMLNTHLTNLRKTYADLLPKGSGMKDFMESNLREYMRKSFAMFTNPNFYPSKEALIAARKYMAEMISKDPLLRMQAKESFPNMPIEKAIAESAELRVADFMETLRYEMDDPLIGMEIAARQNLGLEDIVINTGEELPSVLRKLLGEENNLKASVLQTASSLSHQAGQKIALDKVAELGLKGGWLFRTAAEAAQQGKVLNAQQVKETGTGLLHTEAVGLYGAPEIVGQLNGFNMFDSILKNKIYHNLIAFKATVQGGKTLYSPATQARNFGSASLFALNQGHIGGRVSVGESFKMIMDDIFGAGREAKPQEVIANIQKKIRLGVLDENIVAEELGAVLRELKGQQAGFISFTGLTTKIGDTQLTKLVQRLYAGGDNVWKWHGHEYVKSQLTGNIRSISEISNYFKNVVGREFRKVDDFTGKTKTVADGIEEMAAYMIRETYPTYSRVPPVIQALRKFPFGNFISFPAEIMRTTFAAAGLSLKHIASDNPTLRAMGYKGLLGQLTTLYGVGTATQAISSAMTGIDERQVKAYTNFLGPEYMRFHQLIPITTKQTNGSFKAFDMSAYNPYDYMIAPIEGIIQNLSRARLGSSPSEIDSDMFNTMYAVDGPLAQLISPFIAETIGLEPFFDVLPSGYALGGRGGVTKSGSKVYDKDDTKDQKYNKSFAHILGAVAPGVYSTGTKIYGALQADVSQGQQVNLGDQLFKLMGGSVIIINPNKALDYQVADIKKIRGNVFNTEHFFSESNWQNRPAEVLVAEFEDIQDAAFQAQFQVYQMFKESIGSGLLEKSDVRKILKDRGFSNKQIRNLINGVFTPVTYSESAMEKRAKSIKDAYPGVFIPTINLFPELKLNNVIRKYKNQRFDRYIDPDTAPEVPQFKEKPKLSQATPDADIPVAPLPDTGTPVVNSTQTASGTAVNPQTGLTDAQNVYLSPTEKLYYQRNRTS